MHKKVGIIVQARLGSTRLPKKILQEAVNKPFLNLLIERLRHVKKADHVVVATTAKHQDDPIVALCEKLSVVVCRGSEEDVLDRTYQAAKENGFTTVLRITSDCPLIDPKIVDQCIQAFEDQKVDYLSNTREWTFPRGMDTEIFSFEALEKAWQEANTPYEREHVTPYIYRHPDKFSIGSYRNSEDLSAYRLTLDTPEDLRLLRAIFEALYPENRDFGLDEIVKLLKKNPDWAEWNKHVQQKS